MYYRHKTNYIIIILVRHETVIEKQEIADTVTLYYYDCENKYKKISIKIGANLGLLATSCVLT